MAKIFVSYSRDDSKFVRKLTKKLRHAAVDIWIDQFDIHPGDPWDESIQRALEDCEAMIVVLSPASVASRNVLNEIIFALQENKLVIPVLHRPCKIPLQLRAYEYIDFVADRNAGLPSLLRTLHAAGHAPRPEPPSPHRRNCLWPIMCVTGFVVVTVAAWLFWLYPPRGESSPEIQVYWWPEDPCGWKEHVEWARDETYDSLDTFVMCKTPPLKSQDRQPVLVTIRAGCFPLDEPGKGQLKLTVTDNRNGISSDKKWPEIWEKTSAGRVEATYSYNIAEDVETTMMSVKEPAHILAKDIRDCIWRMYPIYGRINGLRGLDVELNIGRYHGVVSEYLFDVVPARGRTKRIGRIRVDEVDDQNDRRSWARILGDPDKERIVKGCRVINMTEPNSSPQQMPVVLGGR